MELSEKENYYKKWEALALEDLAMDEKYSLAFASINPFYIQARYPSYKEKVSKGLSSTVVESYINLAKGALRWSEQKNK